MCRRKQPRTTHHCVADKQLLLCCFDFILKDHQQRNMMSKHTVVKTVEYVTQSSPATEHASEDQAHQTTNK